jgi:hypothetical protein
MALNPSKDPQHWRKRATEMRKLAEQMNDPEDIAIMRRLADDYERLAERVAKRAREL